MNPREVSQAMVREDEFVPASELSVPEADDKVVDEDAGVIYKPGQDAHVSHLHGIKYNGDKRF